VLVSVLGTGVACVLKSNFSNLVRVFIAIAYILAMGKILLIMPYLVAGAVFGRWL
jgi:uncharacterized membrane protein YqgA involved in biofilm formation